MKKNIVILIVIILLAAWLGVYLWLKNRTPAWPPDQPLRDEVIKINGPTAPPSISEPTSPQPE